MLDQREGVNQLMVLSTVARLADGDGVRQKAIVEATALTKGAVSNNCKKLVDDGVLVESDGQYCVDEDRLLELYRTHFEGHLRRREMPQGFEYYNDIRTATKRQMPDIFEGETSKVLADTLLRVLRGSKEDAHLKILRDVFHRTDDALSAISESTEGLSEEWERDLAMLAVSMDHAPEYVSEEADLSKRAVSKMAKDLKENILNVRS